MRAIEYFKKEINGKKRKDAISLLEEILLDDITNTVKEKDFFSLPLSNIFNIVSQTNLSSQEDPISFIKNLITQTIDNHSDEKETLLLLHSLKTSEIELTLEQCVDILFMFKQCDIFLQLHNKFQENDKSVDIDTEYLIQQKEKEIEELKQELKKSKPLFEPITEKPEDFESDIFIATKDGKLSSVQYLIEKEGININKQTEYDYGDDIISKGCTTLHVACKAGNFKIVQYLIEKGADIELKNVYQSTPLHYACEKGSLQIVQYLIEKGANIETQNSSGNGSLHWASGYGKTNIVKYLISQGANKNAKNTDNRTPFDVACNWSGVDKTQRDIIRELLK